MSRCTNPFGVRLSVDVPNKVVIIRYSDILACHQGILFIHFFSLEIYFGAMLVVVTFVLSDFDGCQY